MTAAGFTGGFILGVLILVLGTTASSMRMKSRLAHSDVANVAAEGSA
jgi:hypothetical protein